ncbi:MAG: NmrA-like family domain containing 1 [Sediminibacterium sp.]|nr:NmrA-like family domain containing 1 [Sediminibacterium sp.]
MEQKKIILVTGATGAQGGSVARALLAGGKFSVRCLTRNAGSGEAKELAAAGATLVEGNLENIASLMNAMQGVYGVFGLTNFWEHFEKEYQQGKNLIDAVVNSNIDYFIYSSLPAAKQISNGQFSLPHFDIKAELQAYAKSLKPDSSFVHVAGYYENFASFCLPQKEADGNFYLRLPQGDTSYASVCVEDLGGIVSTLFDFPKVYKGRTVGAVGADMHCGEYAAILSKVLEKKIIYEAVSRDAYASLGFPGAEELANTYAFNKLFIPNRQLDLIESYGLNPSMQPFEKWVARNKSLIEQALNASAEKVA